MRQHQLPVLATLLAAFGLASSVSFIPQSKIKAQKPHPKATTTRIDGFPAMRMRTKRSLAVGDFEELNRIFEGAVVKLPDTTVSQGVLGTTLNLDITNLRCTGISVGDIGVQYNLETQQKLTMDVGIVELDLTCFLDYRYRYGFLSGSGSADAYTGDNVASITIAFNSDNFNTQPPNSVTSQSCAAAIEVLDLDFRGGFVGFILDTFEGLIRDTVEGAVEGVACDELNALVDTSAQDLVNFVQGTLDPYLLPVSANYSDPLYPENNLIVPPDVNLLDLSDTESIIGGWFNAALSEVDKALGSTVEDNNSPDGSGTDLGINKLLRDNFLDDERAFSIEIDQLSSFTDGIIFSEHDLLTQTNMTLDSIKIFGLDTFTEFDPLVDIGRYTLQNELSWQYLSIEIDVNITIKPSTLPDSVIANPGAAVVEEKMKISFGVDNLHAIVSVLLAINLDTLGSLALGPLLEFDNLVSCLLSTLFQAELSGLSVAIGNIREPTLNGFVSPGVDRVVSTTVEAVFVMYEDILLQSLPSIFETTLRDLLNKDVIKRYLDSSNNVACPSVIFPSGPMDFRDLLLSPNVAALVGGSGTEPYGDLGARLRDLIVSQLTVAGDDGLPAMNSILVAPLTESQSGTAGVLRFADELVNFIQSEFSNKFVDSFVDRFQFTVFDTRISNLDTFTLPLYVVEPSTNAHLLTNLVNVGPVANRELTGKIRFLLSLEGDGSPLEMRNEFDVVISTPTTIVSADIIAKIDGVGLSSFPLEDLLDADCWLSTIVSGGGGSTSLGFSSFLLSLAGLNLGVDCISCTSPGVAVLSGIADLLETTGVIRVVRERMEGFVEELFVGEWAHELVDRLLEDAPQGCPHNPLYNATTKSDNSAMINVPQLSRQLVEGVVLAGVIIVDVAVIVFAESHVRMEKVGSDPLSGQASLQPSNTADYLDWTDLSGTLGDFGNQAFEQLRQYFNGSTTESSPGLEDLALNTLLRDTILDENRSLTFEFKNTSFSEAGVQIDLQSIRVAGLDSLTDVFVFDPIAPQTLRSNLVWDNLTIEIDVGVIIDQDGPLGTEAEDKATIEMGITDFAMDFSLLLALNATKLGDVEIQSLLKTTSIVNCLLSAVDAIDLTQILVNVGSVQVPSVRGFLSSQVQNLLTDAISTLYRTYGSTLIEAIPPIFDETLRPLVNNLIQVYMDSDENAACSSPSSSTKNGVIDFRDLLLTQEDARAAGGTGTAPYGNIVPLLKDLLDNELLAIDSDSGEPLINDVLIRPLTKGQSNVEGLLRFNDDIATIDSQIPQVGINSLILQLSDARIENLDSVGMPLALLEPNSTSGQLLDNSLSIGASPNDLQAKIRLLLEIEGDPALEMRNELDISVSLSDTGLFLVALARISEMKLLSFPLRDLAALDCWLAMFVTPQLDSQGVRLPSLEPSLALDYLSIAVGNLHFNASCVSCSSTGLLSLPDVMAVLDSTGAIIYLTDRMAALVTELAGSDYLETVVDRVLFDSSHKCPHSPMYVENYTSPLYSGGPSIPSLSRESLETAIMAVTIAVESAAVILAQTQTTMNATASNPLSAQNELVVPDNVTLLDLSNLGDVVGSWFDSAVDEINNYLGGLVDDDASANGQSQDLGVNVLLRSFLLDGNQVLTIPVNSSVSSQNGMELSLNDVRIIGLDSFLTFEAFDAIGPQTILNRFSLDMIRVEFDISITLPPSSSSSSSSFSSFSSSSSNNNNNTQAQQPEAETLTISFGLRGVEGSIGLLLAIDQDKLGMLSLASILNLDDILSCLLSTTVSVQLSQLSIEAQGIEGLEMSGFLSSDVEDLIADSTRALLNEYEDDLLGAMPGLFDRTLRTLANNWIEYYFGSVSSYSCSSYSQDSAVPNGVVDFRDLLLTPEKSVALGGEGNSSYGDLFEQVMSVMDAELLRIDESDGTSEINRLLIGPLTRSQSGSEGTLGYQGDLLDSGARIRVGGLDATIQVRAYDGRIENLDTVGSPLSILDPVNGEPHLLDHTMTFGVDGRPLRFAVNFLMSLKDDETEIRNEVSISLDLKSAMLVLETLIKISEPSLFNFPLRDILNINCWLATMPAPPLDATGVRLENTDPSAALTQLFVSLSQLSLNVTCISCTSPEIEELSRMLADPTSVEDVTATANDVLDYVTTLLGGEFLQVQIDRFLNEAPKSCPHRPEYQENPVSFSYEQFAAAEQKDDTINLLIALVVSIACLVGVVVLVVLVVKFIVRRRNKAWVARLPEDHAVLLHSIQTKQEAKTRELNQTTQSMFMSDAIPCYVRYIVPVVIVGNIGFFLSGHLSLGATVNIEAKLAGQSLTVSEFFEFSLARSTIDIWNAGAKELAILLLIFSGVWPYTKQLITLALWFLPPRVVSLSTRGSTFLWLDALAKWSMVDIFVLIMSVASFRVTIKSPDVSFLPEGFYSVDLLVVPLWGLYANMIAQLISQVSSHFIIHYHRRIVGAANDEYDQRNGLLQAETLASSSESEDDSGVVSLRAAGGGDTAFRLKDHAFARPHRGESDRLQARRGVGSMLVVMSILLSLFVIVGCSIPSFSLESLGVVGLAVESGQEFEEAVTQHTLFSIIRLLFEEAEFIGEAGAYVGLATLSLLLFLTVMIVPMVQSLLLLRQWFWPLTERERRHASVMVETLQAWQYVEVFLLAIVVSSWQLGPLSEFMINDYCTGLESAFASLAYYGILKPDDAQCFRVQGRVENGTYCLMVGAVLLALLNTLVMKAVFQRDRDMWNATLGITGEVKLADALSPPQHSEESVAMARVEITPPPTLFTDQFRWLLEREPLPLLCSVEEVDAQSISDSGSEKEELPPAPLMPTVVERDAYPPGHYPLADVDLLADADLLDKERPSMIFSPTIAVGIPFKDEEAKEEEGPRAESV